MNGRARLAALKTLERCRRSGAWSDAVIGAVMDEQKVTGPDRALATKICYGVEQNRNLLDFYISNWCSQKPEKLEPKVLDILRCGAYQIVFMDRVPDFAAANESVSLCKKLGFGRAAGLVNAVLRRICENKDNLPEPGEMYIKYSVPKALCDLFVSQFGEEEAEKLLRAQNEPEKLNIQVNTTRTTAQKLKADLEEQEYKVDFHPYLPDCLVADSIGTVNELEQFWNGDFYIQDAAARLSVMAAGVKEGDTVLDVCSAPGGKSFAAAIAAGGKCSITACDIHENKLKRIRDTARRLGFTDIISTCVADGREFKPEWEEQFDVVICDVPCSGLGVIRKKPDIRNKDLSETVRLPEIQIDILRNASRYVKNGGTLIYSTCTIRREENSEVTALFMENNNNFTRVDFTLPGNICSQNGERLMLPHVDGTDGFFFAKFRRK